MNGLLLRRPGQTILVDAGPGVLIHLWAFEGIHSDAAAALAAAGASTRGGRPRRAHAPRRRPHRRRPRRRDGLALPERANRRARGGDRRRSRPARGCPSASRSGRSGSPTMRGHGVLDLFEPGELAEGVTARSAPGHRAGHVLRRGRRRATHSSTSPTRSTTTRTSSTPSGTGPPTTTARSRSRPAAQCLPGSASLRHAAPSPPTSPASSRSRELPHHTRGRPSPLHGSRRGRAHDRARSRLEGLPPHVGSGGLPADARVPGDRVRQPRHGRVGQAGGAVRLRRPRRRPRLRTRVARRRRRDARRAGRWAARSRSSTSPAAAAGSAGSC